MITLEQLRQIMPYADAPRAALYLVPLNEAMAEYEINTPRRQCAFLAQVAHESGSLRYVRELASGAAYEFRKDLGNTMAGDGKRYKGRGLIQITGRNNYRLCSLALYGQAEMLLAKPELLEAVTPACRSAGWFWQSNKLNALADENDFTRITLRINGGQNGAADRQIHYARACEVLAC